ncbi:MAG: RNB domain-containing ribonuclease [Nocardioidaceae bacterium]|nr:MAG: RNB domain-containing ribonuclease [Nocardioidaceae bacterium]
MRVVHVGEHAWHADGEGLAAGVAQVRRELGIATAFPVEVLAAAEQAAANPVLPALDRTDLAFVTIDPEGARDLDQALYLERRGEGYRVYYAIADVAAFVRPGDAIDLEANKRGETLYGADSKIPLHPPVLSEGAASLLANQVRPALLWIIDLDAEGEGTAVTVQRALVRSRKQLTYTEVQQQFDNGTIDGMLALLKVVGELRMAKEAARGGVSLPLPAQEIELDDQGHWSLEYRRPEPVELWNAQISLLTGMGAASLMVQHRVGLLRTLPPAAQRDLDRLRRVAKALGVPWPKSMSYPEFIRSIDPASSRGAAVLVAATRTLRGATYVGFDGEVPDQPRHAALANEYAHVTAPLRRLIDRYALEICVAICAGEPVPAWVLDKLEALPQTMREADRLAGQYERALLDLLETAVLSEYVGHEFDGVIVSVDEKKPTQGVVMIDSPAIEAKVSGPGPLPLGESVRVRLVEADAGAHVVRFELVDRSG